MTIPDNDLPYLNAVMHHFALDFDERETLFRSTMYCVSKNKLRNLAWITGHAIDWLGGQSGKQIGTNLLASKMNGVRKREVAKLIVDLCITDIMIAVLGTVTYKDGIFSSPVSREDDAFRRDPVERLLAMKGCSRIGDIEISPLHLKA